MYLQCAPIYWFSKKQKSVESLSFGSDFCAMKQCCEYLRGMFAHLKKYHNSELVFDPSYSPIEEGLFDRQDWTNSEFGHVAGEKELTGNAPPPLGKEFLVRAKVDADHAGDTQTRISRTGFIVYLQCAPIYWFR